jgi:nitroreductase
MEFDNVIDERKSVRTFNSKKVNWKYILEAVDDACKGPFADGDNNLKFLIIEEPGTILKIAELASQIWINEAQALVVICSDDTHLENKHGERGRVYSRQQAGAAIENFLLKITEQGLASCWVGSYSDEMLKQVLKIPMHIQIEALLPVGHEKGKVKQKKKKDLEHAIFWEEWDKRKRSPFIKEVRDQFGLA